jgi:hypothetical protein
VWLLYGIQPLGVTSRTVPGQCKGRAHRRSTLGLPGRWVLVSRKWSGKTLAGVPAPEVAQRAGHSVDVLLKVYAKCIEGDRVKVKGG